jgi:predicted secreted protein
VLSLTTTATVEVAQDVLTVTFATTHEGSQAQAVQSMLKQALDAALSEAKKIAKPGEVDVRTGNFSLYPRYGNPRNGQPVITGWQGSAELVVQGRDVASIAELTGRVTTMSIARVGYTLSNQAREKVEADAVAQAIAQWRDKATQTSRQFGYSDYSVREVTVSTSESGGGRVPMPMARAQAMSVAEQALPTEAGKAEVVATVSGSVQMTR